VHGKAPGRQWRPRQGIAIDIGIGRTRLLWGILYGHCRESAPGAAVALKFV
jgi:hypothetical protein